MKLSTEQPKILVVGSSSVDLVLNTETFPYPGHTVMAVKSETFFGGKGANQAVGTSRLGASVYFVGCVGMDPHGQQIMRNLVDENVNVGYVVESEEYPTGTAYVTATGGENAIVVVPAANYYLKTAHIDHAERLFHTADLVLIQLEIPMEVVEYTVKLAKRHRRKVMLYAAPASRLSEELIDNVDFIVAKSNELSVVFENKNLDEVLRLYPNKLFVRDNNSTTYFNGSEMRYYRNDHEEGSNKMGMGDAFTSGFAVAFCHGNPVDACVKFGNEVSLKVARIRGSQKGLPYLDDFRFG